MFNLIFNLVYSAVNFFFIAFPTDYGAIIFIRHHTITMPQIGKLNVFHFFTQILGNEFRAGYNRYIFQHFFTSVAESRRLNRQNIKYTAKLVDHQSRKRFAFNVFGNNHQFFFSGFNQFFQKRK